MDVETIEKLGGVIPEAWFDLIARAIPGAVILIATVQNDTIAGLSLGGFAVGLTLAYTVGMFFDLSSSLLLEWMFGAWAKMFPRYFQSGPDLWNKIENLALSRRSLHLKIMAEGVMFRSLFVYLSLQSMLAVMHSRVPAFAALARDMKFQIHPFPVSVFLTCLTFCCWIKMGAIAASRLGTAGGNSLDQMIVNKSKETWEAYKSRNIAAIKALTAEDYVAHTLTGLSNLQQDIATIDKLTIESYTIDDPKLSMATKDVAILRYKCDLKGSLDGKPFRPVYATEVWVNRGGKWQMGSYSETPLS